MRGSAQTDRASRLPRRPHGPATRLRAYCAALLVFFCASLLPAQGFDWQYDARMPSDYPDLFFGLDFAAGGSSYTGQLQHTEKIDDPFDGSLVCRECGIFDSGSDSYLSFGLRGEYWVDALWTVRAGVGYVSTDMHAQRDLPDLPSLDFGAVSSELQFESTRRRVALDVGMRRRMLDRFSVGGALNTAILLSESIEQNQQIIAPAEAAFLIDGVYSSTRPVVGELSSAADLLFSVDLGVYYDAPLARGLYAVSGLVASIPLHSATADQSWRGYGLRLNVSLLYGRP